MVFIYLYIQKFPCELAKLSLCLSFFYFTTTLHDYLLLLTVCFSVHVHLSLVILCFCGLVSPPLSSFSSSLFFVLLYASLTFPSPALSPTLSSPPPPTFSFFPPHPSISCLLAVSLLLSHCPSSSLPLSFTPSLPPPCSVRDKFVEVDLKPVCKHCYERLPDDMKRRLAKRERDSKEKKKKLLIPMCL